MCKYGLMSDFKNDYVNEVYLSDALIIWTFLPPAIICCVNI